jgi:WS/DGAT/MGAT family acyltransferase
MSNSAQEAAGVPDRMDDAEHLMWRLDRDPHLSATFANVTVLDRMPDLDTLRRRMIRASTRIPRLRQRVHAPSFGPPSWVDDPDFDIDRNVRRVTLPAPRSERSLLDLAAAITAEPFDHAHPLWEFVVVGGLPGRRAALLEKLHHTITDGEGGIQLALEFLDLERDAPPPPPLHEPTHHDAHDAGHHDAGLPRPTDDEMAEVVRSLAVAALRIPTGVARRVGALLADPTTIPTATASASATLGELVAQLGDVDRARSPLWTERSLGRRIEVASAPFGTTRAAARRLGGTLNTAFVTVAAEAASRYHLELGAPVESLRTSMAVSTRTADSGANAFDLVRLLVPTGEMGIAERFQAVREATITASTSAPATSMATVAALASLLPTAVVTRLARLQSQTVDFATSNVQGSPVPVYAAGAKLLHNYPVGPLGGVAFNLTLLSYAGNLDIGIHVDTAAVAEPDRLRRCLAEALSDLAACR